jgi:N-acetylglutamate synthase-like GNAT family acetyltransferase
MSTQRRQEDIVVRRADPMDWPRIEAFCRERGYRGFLSSEAAVVIAERGLDVAGLGRVQLDNGVLVLRGMGVDSRFRRRGIGTRLLELLVAEIGARRCYCIPYAHLREFYGRAGFADLDLDSAPHVLRDRTHEYRNAGNDVILMCRPGGADMARSPAGP